MGIKGLNLYWLGPKLSTFPAFKPKSRRSGEEGLSERGVMNDVFGAESWVGVSVTGTVFASGLLEIVLSFTTNFNILTCEILTKLKKST